LAYAVIRKFNAASKNKNAAITPKTAEQANTILKDPNVQEKYLQTMNGNDENLLEM
jgi:hypothetical protein